MKLKLKLRISRLTWRILAVNIAPLLILGLGLLYTGQYERQLIEAELKALTQEGQLFAAALAEGGVRENLDNKAILADDLARLMVRKFSEKSDVRLVLFDVSGNLVADSHQLMGQGGLIEMVELPPPHRGKTITHAGRGGLEYFMSLLPTRLRLPMNLGEGVAPLQAYPHALNALSGEVLSQAWHTQERKILLTSALPIQRLKQVLGGLLISREGGEIDKAVAEVQWTVLRIFAVALLITVLLSIYLAGMIARPIVRLAYGAERVRRDHGAYQDIPDFSHRNDEIGMLSKALRRMTLALYERMNLIESFAADVAHELKNPLASIKSAIETLGRIKDEDKQQKLITVIQDDIKRMDRLITEISMASRLDTELGRMELDEIDLNALLRGITSVQNTREDTHNYIVFKAEAPLKTMGHEGQLAQVVLNLLDNARSFATTKTDIICTLSKQGGMAEISVSNEGVQIPEAKLENIFARFYSERPTAEKFGTHSGLGLSISKQIVEAHKGRIWAKNIEKPAGVCIKFTLPLLLD